MRSDESISTCVDRQLAIFNLNSRELRDRTRACHSRACAVKQANAKEHAVIIALQHLNVEVVSFHALGVEHNLIPLLRDMDA